MSAPMVDVDRFGIAIEDILDKVGRGVDEKLPEAIQRGVRRGASEWRRQIRANFPEGKTYRKHGKTYEIGRYQKSVRSHMLVKTGPRPSGEVGVPRMPGLAHLLEYGHAKVGGGRVRAIPHVEPARKIAYDATLLYVDETLKEVLDDI